MPFDPTYPPTNALIESAPLRGQFNGLKDLIDALPTGAGITGAVVDAVTTQPPGTQAMVSVSLVGGELHFSFGIPEGSQGSQGSQGSNGNDGAPGQQGPQGIPGEVSQTDLNNATLNVLSQSSNITNNVNTLTTVAPMDYEPPVLQEVIDKLNELVLALRR